MRTDTHVFAALRRRLNQRVVVAAAVLGLIGATLAGVLSAQAAASWTALGSTLNTNTSCCVQVSTKVDANGNPSVAFVESSGTQTWLRVATWRSGAWVRLGGALNTGTASLSSNGLALDATGNPVVAWTDGGQGRVSQWNGSAWTNVGSAFANAGDGYSTIVSTSPLIASFYSYPSHALSLVQWNGSAWTTLATRAAPGYGVSFPASVTANAAGTIFVAWRGLRSTGGSGDWDLVVEQDVAGSWSALGGPLNVNAAWGVGMAQLRTANGQLAVLFTETYFRQPTNTYVKTWAGGTWTQLGGALDSGVSGGGLSLALDGNAAPVEASATSMGQLLVRSWDGSAWQQVGGTINPSPGPYPVGPASIDSGSSVLVLTWVGAVSGSSSQSYGAYVSSYDSSGSTTTTTTAATTTTPGGTTTTTEAPTTTTTVAATTTTTVAPTTTTAAPTTTTTVASTTTTAAPTTTTTVASTTTTMANGAGNLVPNPGFELPGTPRDYWGSSVTRSSAVVHGGSYALAQTTSSSSGGWDTDVDRAWYAPVVVGKTYTATIWVRATATVAVTPYVDVLSSGASVLDSLGSPRVTLAANTWTKLAVTFTPTSREVTAVFEPNFSSAAKGTVLYWDDMSIVAN